MLAPQIAPYPLIEETFKGRKIMTAIPIIKVTYPPSYYLI